MFMNIKSYKALLVVYLHVGLNGTRDWKQIAP